MFDRSLGRGADARPRFRRWLAQLLLDHEGISPPRPAGPGSGRAGGARPRSRGPAARR
jgi:hypothetical protein